MTFAKVMARAGAAFCGLCLLLCAHVTWAQTCTTTISAGSSIATAVTNVVSGGTVCLNAGSYSAFNSSITKSSMTTIISAPGLTRNDVTVAGVDVGTSQYLTFERLTIGGADVGTGSSPALHIAFKNIRFTGSVCVNNPTNVNQDTLIDGSSFAGIGQGCTEGRLGITGNNVSHSVASGIVISNNVFGPGGASDGVQIIGGARGVQILNNEFTGIKQSGCGATHCDPIQFYGAVATVIDGNYFHGNSTGIMSPDCNGDPMTVRNNVFHSDGEYPDQIVDGGGANDVFEHNTFHNATIRLGNVNGCGAVTGATIRSNIITGGLNLSNGQSSSGFTMSHNMGSSSFGTNFVTGTPVYIGGSTPSTYAGFELTSGSPGNNAGHDGNDIGVVFTAGPPDTEAPTTPTSPSATPVGSTQINLSWTSSTDNVAIGGYNVERCTGSGCSNWSEVQATSGTGTTWNNTGLTASTLYRYRIRARDAVPNYSGYSTIVQATTNAPAQYTVTPSEAIGTSHGSIVPNTAQSVTEGTTTQFTVTPDATYQSFVGGTCGGSLVGTTYTTSSIIGNCSVIANFIPSSCSLLNTANTPSSTAMATQTGSFTYRFSLIPAATTHDIVGGHTNGAWTAYTSYATGVLFGPTGTVTVRNGGSYAATTTFNYVANAQYNVRMLVNITSHTYSVWIAPDGGSETQIAANYAFRTDQASVTQLNNFAFVAATGSTLGAYVCPIGITSSGPPDAPTNYRLLQLDILATRH